MMLQRLYTSLVSEELVGNKKSMRMKWRPHSQLAKDSLNYCIPNTTNNFSTYLACYLLDNRLTKMWQLQKGCNTFGGSTCCLPRRERNCLYHHVNHQLSVEYESYSRGYHHMAVVSKCENQRMQLFMIPCKYV